MCSVRERAGNELFSATEFNLAHALHLTPVRESVEMEEKVIRVKFCRKQNKQMTDRAIDRSDRVNRVRFASFMIQTIPFAW